MVNTNAAATNRRPQACGKLSQDNLSYGHGSKLQATSYKRQAASFKRQASSYKLQAVNNK